MALNPLQVHPDDASWITVSEIEITWVHFLCLYLVNYAMKINSLGNYNRKGYRKVEVRDWCKKYEVTEHRLEFS